MAKDTKKNAPAKVELNIDNVEEQLKSLNFSNQEIAKQAADKSAEEDQKRAIRETQRAQDRARYVNLYAVLIMKKRRDYARIDKKLADDTKTLLADVEGGKVTFREFDNKLDNLFDERKKNLQDADKKHDSLVKELDDAFSEKCNTWDINWKFDNHGRRLW